MVRHDAQQADQQYHIETIPLLTAAQVSDQIALAHSVQPAWAATSFAQRKQVLQNLRRWVIKDMEGIVDVACRDTGKTRMFTRVQARREVRAVTGS